MKGLLIFDVDATIVDDNDLLPVRRQALLEAVAKRHACDVEGARRLLAEAQKSMPESRKHTSVYVFQEVGFTRREFFDVIDGVAPEGLAKLFPDAKEVLERLAKEYVLVIYSNTPLVAVQKSLRYLGVLGLFKTIHTSDQYEVSKPSSELLLRIIKEEGRTPEQAVVIGDSLKKDVLPAVAIGAKGVLFDPDKRFPSSEDYIVVCSFNELLQKLDADS